MPKGQKQGNANTGKAKKTRSPKIKGKGDYIVSKIADKIKQMIPKGTFESKGAKLGAYAGRKLAQFTGVGDYVFNDIVHTPGLPTRHAARAQTISNCEFITDLTNLGGTVFTTKTFYLNPADVGTFPWLARVASLYSKYRFRQLIFEFRSNTSDYASAGPLGSVVFAPQYNIDASAFVTKQQMEAATHAVSAKPSNSVMCGIECSPEDDSIKWHWVRKANATPTNLTDHGKFTYATSGLPTSQGAALGELWVHYTIELIEPILEPNQTISTYVYGQVISKQTNAGYPAVTFAGWSGFNSNCYNYEDPYIASDLKFYRVLTQNSLSSADFLVSVNTTDAKYWTFRYAGTYRVTYFMNLSTGFTAGAGHVYDATVTQGNGSVNSVAGETTGYLTTGDDRKFYSGTSIVKTSVDNTEILWALAPSFTGGSSTVIDSTNGALIRVERLF